MLKKDDDKCVDLNGKKQFSSRGNIELFSRKISYLYLKQGSEYVSEVGNKLMNPTIALTSLIKIKSKHPLGNGNLTVFQLLVLGIVSFSACKHIC